MSNGADKKFIDQLKKEIQDSFFSEKDKRYCLDLLEGGAVSQENVDQVFDYLDQLQAKLLEEQEELTRKIADKKSELDCLGKEFLGSVSAVEKEMGNLIK
ncbi:MAG TPA: hypothetical protein ENF20_05075 [Candidatus Marinimicrobia bacterium]|nr:hypothetical protein [Candidatus Neomarinimicrobiota bacterium]